MKKSIERFINRLHLKPELKSKVRIIKIHEINKSFDDKGFGKIELYHSPRSIGIGIGIDDTINSIIKNGFMIQPFLIQNKGRGIYFANHSRYAWLWGGPKVMICDVIANPKYIKRFRSEIDSGSEFCNSEYVITDPSIIFPKYVLEYEIERGTVDKVIGLDSAYKKLGFFGCEKCDQLLVRCDCPLDPNVDPNDFV